jgi:ABC-2 type transport system ATP-binding protein
VMFLDEPTAGLDPRSRNEIWDAVRALVADGATVLLTTQYLDEADQLADRVAVVDAGRVIATGTPDELKAAIGSRLDVVVRDAAALPAAGRVLEKVTGNAAAADPEQRRVGAATSAGAVPLTDLVRELDSAGVAVEDVALRRPTLDEVFLSLTGQPAGVNA